MGGPAGGRSDTREQASELQRTQGNITGVATFIVLTTGRCCSKYYTCINLDPHKGLRQRYYSLHFKSQDNQGKEGLRKSPRVTHGEGWSLSSGSTRTLFCEPWGKEQHIQSSEETVISGNLPTKALGEIKPVLHLWCSP